MQIIINREQNNEFDENLTKLKLMLDTKSGNKAVQDAVKFYVQEKPVLIQKERKALDKFDELKFNYDRLILQLKIKKDAEKVINEYLKKS